MNLHFENLVVLFGLFALAIPIILHLLQRRRHDILDWGAMQFLPDSISAMRRRWLDEILLMLLRMAMIALVVLALATPISTSDWLAVLRDRSTRDVVLILDGSYSMDLRLPKQPSPWEEAIRWANEHVQQSTGGDRFAVLIARQPAHYPLTEFSGDVDEVSRTLSELPRPRGNPDVAGALAEAWTHLQSRSRAAAKEIIVLTDQQHFGWADLETLSALERVGDQWHADVEGAKTDGRAIPSLRVLRVGAPLPASLPNYSLAPLRISRQVLRPGQLGTFHSALHLDGFMQYMRPRTVQFAIDGKVVGNLPLPDKSDLKQGQVPLTFQHRFDREGQHVVSLKIDVDCAQDVLGADNEQHAVIDVVKQVPILLIDGDRELSPQSSSFFLQRALAGKQAGSKGLMTIPYPAFQPGLLSDVRPAVVVLADVPRLTTGQLDALDRFVAEGGGLLIWAGERVATAKVFYNDQLYRQGQGWLPARLDDVAGTKEGMQPEPGTFQHPALELLRPAQSGIQQVRFSQWWKVRLPAKDRGSAVALLANGDPLILEKPYRQGRVMFCTVPPDRSWGSTLPGAAEFPILVHELTTYLAGSKPASCILEHGAPLRLPVRGATPFRLWTPESMEQPIDISPAQEAYHNTGPVGVYRLQGADGHRIAFVVQPDLRESNLRRCSGDDWRKVRERLPVAWHSEPGGSSHPLSSRREELWWLALLLVIGLLSVEVWMTRRMIRKREARS